MVVDMRHATKPRLLHSRRQELETNRFPNPTMTPLMLLQDSDIDVACDYGKPHLPSLITSTPVDVAADVFWSRMIAAASSMSFLSIVLRFFTYSPSSLSSFWRISSPQEG